MEKQKTKAYNKGLLLGIIAGLLLGTIAGAVIAIEVWVLPCIDATFAQ